MVISWCLSYTPARHTSLRLDTDLHAYLSPVARSVHRYVVPNCLLPSFRSRRSSGRTSNIGRCSTVPISPPLDDARRFIIDPDPTTGRPAGMAAAAAAAATASACVPGASPFLRTAATSVVAIAR